MTIKKWVAAVALLAISSSALATEVDYEFDSITNLAHNGYVVVGVLVNDTAPTTLTLNGVNYPQCLSWLELMMTDPGKFTLAVTVTTIGGPIPPVSINLTRCQLNAKP